MKTFLQLFFCAALLTLLGCQSGSQSEMRPGELSVYATAPTQIIIRSDGTDEVLYKGLVEPSSSVTVNAYGYVVLIATKIENIQASINGDDKVSFEGQGVRKVRLYLAK